MNNITQLQGWEDYRPNSDVFTNKIALITGAADGIGRALTIALAELGATVLMLDKKSRHLEKLYDQIVAQQFCEPVILPVDLIDTSATTATQLAQAIKSDFGQLDILLHNAAELGSPSPLDQYDMEYWQQVMQVNLQAPYLLTRALLPLLKQQTPTHVLFSSANIGRNPKAYAGAYGVAYAGIEAQMTIWAQELENVSNIQVNSIDPGPVRTVMRRRSHPGEDQAQLITPQQVAMAYLMVLGGKPVGTGCRFAVQ